MPPELPRRPARAPRAPSGRPCRRRPGLPPREWPPPPPKGRPPGARPGTPPFPGRPEPRRSPGPNPRPLPSRPRSALREPTSSCLDPIRARRLLLRPGHVGRPRCGCNRGAREKNLAHPGVIAHLQNAPKKEENLLRHNQEQHASGGGRGAADGKPGPEKKERCARQGEQREERKELSQAADRRADADEIACHRGQVGPLDESHPDGIGREVEEGKEQGEQRQPREPEEEGRALRRQVGRVFLQRFSG